jgi:hypothetical protein
MTQVASHGSGRWDEWGFEGPFEPPGREHVAHGGAALSQVAELESPFRESNELGTEASSAMAEFVPNTFPEAVTVGEEREASEGVASEAETFPSGAILQRATGATGRDEEHWDPNATGLPLLATGPATHGLRLSRNFTVGELFRSGGRAAAVARIAPALVDVLQRIRDRAGKSIRITSGYRSWARNNEIYRARGQRPTLSRHCSGQAADIKIIGLSGTQIAQLIIDAAGPDLAIGVGADFVHVDVRGAWTLWTYLSGGAGKTAMDTVREYRERRARGGAPVRPVPPSPTPPSLGLANATVGRLVVDRHPMLRPHVGTAPDLVMHWNAIAQPGEVDVVVHFHGFSGNRSSMQLPRDKEPNSGLDFSDPAGLGGSGRNRPTLGLLPRGHFYGGRSGMGYSFPALIHPGALIEFINDALARFSRQTGIAVSMGRLILTAHSGGGAALAMVLAHTDPDEVHVFDGLYGPGDALVRWAGRRISRELATPATIPPALRILYRPGGTQPPSETVARSLCPLLQTPGAGRLTPHFRVDRTQVAHNDIPRRFGWALLADSAAELPGVTRRECSPRRSGESAESHAQLSEPSNEWQEADRQSDALDEGEGIERLGFAGTEGSVHEGYEPEGDEPEGYEGATYEAEAYDGDGRESDTFEPEQLDWEEAQGLAATSDSAERAPSEEELFDLERRQWHNPDLVNSAYEAEVLELESRESAAEESESLESEGAEAEALESGPALHAAESETESGQLTLESLLEAEAGVDSSVTDRLKGMAAFALGPTLRRGSRGPAVATLQRALASLAFDVHVDGSFGPNTERAVRAFQTRAGLTTDGFADAPTKAAIATALAGGPASTPAPSPPRAPHVLGNQLCDAIARTAEREYQRWHPPSGDIHETDLAATPILRQYYREGVGAEISAADLQSKTWQGSHPWSAVFVSWVMRTAGTDSAFRYSRGHYVYVAAARQNRLSGNAANPFWAFRPTEVAPQVGDLICASRENSGATYDNIGDGQMRATHCDIVTEVRPGSLRVVGGNVRQNVDAKRIRTLSDGRLALDGTQARFFAVVRCRGDVNAAPGPSTRPTPPPGPAPSAPSGAKLTAAAFVGAYGPYAKASESATGVPALVTLGQAALESGWGQHAPRFNFFGIKARVTDPEPTRQLLKTKEVLSRPDVRSFPQVFSVTRRPDGRYDYVVSDWFRAYPSAADAFRAHGEFLRSNKRYSRAFATSDPYTFATEVARAGYATDPSYPSVLHQVMRSLAVAGFQ